MYHKKVKVPNNNHEEINKISEDESKLGLVESIKNAPPIQNIHGESLMLFEPSKYQGKSFRHFYGIGKVFRVVKGDHQDLVYMRFGALDTYRIRLVVVYDNHPRRQVLTLKRGQVAQVYGVCRLFKKWVIDKKTGNKKNITSMGLYAYGFNNWYLPTMLDVRKMPTNEDINTPTEKEETLLQDFDKILDEFMNGNGEDEDE